MVKVISVKAIENHKLCVSLSNDKKGIFDVSPYLEKGVFKELKKKHYFRLVKVAFGGVMWPDEQDFSPETIDYELKQEESTLTRSI